MNIKHSNSSFPFETQAFRLFRDLEYEILAGKWKPGQKLTRREISNRFEVSQATVTEALWRLEADGLAESVPMFGTRVTGITVQRVKDEVVLREALECQVARLVAETTPSDDLTPLNKLAEQVDAMMRNADTYSREGMETHQEFHLALARLTRSSLLIREVERIWRRHCIFFNWVSAKVLPVPEHWHRTLLGAIGTGDPNIAENVMRQHVTYGSTHQLEVLRKMSEDAFSVKT